MNTLALVNKAPVVETSVAMPDGRLRLSDADLHRLASKAIWEANLLVFDSLMGTIHQIIENKTWKSFHHDSFASYALDASTNGLKVNSNQRLWILRCAMDVYGKHIKQWAEVLAQVESMVRVEAKKDGFQVGSRSKFNGNSLDTLAKQGPNVGPIEKITYLPSRQKAHDGHLIRLLKNDKGAYSRVISGKARLADILRERKAKSVRQNDVLAYLRYHWNRATASERKTFIAWTKKRRS